MNKRRAQVFIATTQGLVQVLSIDRINGTNIESAVTIDNTSKIAGISHFYHNFVVKPQGLIHDIFGGKAFRLNLSKDIDQGESWQLGVFLAHYLYENDCLSNGKNTLTKQTTNDDFIYIATGRVDTLHYQVLSIDELAKKCLHANRHIAHWQSTNQQISFLAPTKNFRQPIPNSILKLTPVSHLSELFHLCTLNGVLTEALVFPNAIEASVSNNVVTIDDIHQYNNNIVVDESENLETQVNNANSSATKPEFSIVHFTKRYATYFYLLLTIALIALIVVSINAFSPSKESLVGNNNYAVIAKISENRNSCLLANDIIISKGVFDVNIEANTTNINNLCDLQFVTSSIIKKIWLVSDTKAIISLTSVKINKKALDEKGGSLSQLYNQHDANIKWAVPLPKNKTLTRKFTLVAFVKAPDEADYSSLERYLDQLHLRGKPHDIDNLQEWIAKTQLNNKVFVVDQKLAIYR